MRPKAFNMCGIGGRKHLGCLTQKGPNVYGCQSFVMITDCEIANGDLIWSPSVLISDDHRMRQVVMICGCQT